MKARLCITSLTDCIHLPHARSASILDGTLVVFISFQALNSLCSLLTSIDFIGVCFCVARHFPSVFLENKSHFNLVQFLPIAPAINKLELNFQFIRCRECYNYYFNKISDNFYKLFFRNVLKYFASVLKNCTEVHISNGSSKSKSIVYLTESHIIQLEWHKIYNFQ